jgi:glutaredoxin-like protein NrdH
MISVTVYSTGPNCMQCTMTCRALTAEGISFHIEDLRKSAAALAFVTQELGYTQAPVVILDQEPQFHWSGFRPDLIAQLAQRVSASNPPTAPQPVRGIGLR